MVRYCPLGQPALLTGDFYENVARIPDFSWSVLLSSNPNTGSHEKSCIPHLLPCLLIRKFIYIQFLSFFFTISKFQTIFIFAVMIFYHLLIPCMVIHYACDASIRPSMKEYPSFRLPGLKVFFLLTAVLVFFFAPGVSTPSDVCPPKIERVCSEIYFWTIFPYLFFSFASIKYLVYACQTKTFYLLENKTIIGEIKEKEGFGWITHIDEEKKPVVVSQ
ncbi:Protein CBG25973 [Caenorhabditis briggsae]|uniref:Protein CBG25973 n=1 Tax=Caenorhabditis briggsae TaxID=6238 RepID=B6IKS3_CAEBR|nr:Protein CBG25973 [Caenorhabditis briggsae]CAS00503.1 Protein CBG25973 [Caenorhabditis briggsae]